jgi:DedD protein
MDSAPTYRLAANRSYTSPVERHVKERLVGAAVLMAAAVILVPEMLSGPPEEKRVEAPRASGETPVKTYTIDLSKPSPQAAADDVPDTRAPPNEMPPPADAPSAAPSDASDVASVNEEAQADPESSRGETAEKAASNTPPEVKTPTPPAKESAPPSKQTPSKVAAPPVAESPRAPIASSASAPRSGSTGWAVQLGSFSSQATADRLSAEMRAQGYDSFVMPVKSNGSTLYRVRIGPMPSRELADETLRKVKGKVPGAAIVAHR